jgi:hypothetical protein
MRAPFDVGEATEFQDGMHGLLVWGIATLLAGIITAATLQLVPRTPGVAAAAPGAATSFPEKA